MSQPLVFGHYRVMQREDGSYWELSRNALCVAYKGEDMNLECPVVLKVFKSSAFPDAALRQRFINEARAAARLQSDSIAAVHHLGSTEDYFFYAMDYVEGETAQAMVERLGPMPVEMALRVGIQVARALSAAKREGLVHRHITPAHIVIVAHAEAEQGGPIVKLIDFGSIRSTIMDHHSGATIMGFVGTPQYASPEHIEETNLDVRSDIYSLGCVMWFLLTGHPPFQGSVASTFAQQLQTSPPLHELKKFSKKVRRLLGRMLRKNPSERPNDPAILRRMMEQCLGAADQRKIWSSRVLVGSRAKESARRLFRGLWLRRMAPYATGGVALLVIAGLFAKYEGDRSAWHGIRAGKKAPPSVAAAPHSSGNLPTAVDNQNDDGSVEVGLPVAVGDSASREEDLAAPPDAPVQVASATAPDSSAPEVQKQTEDPAPQMDLAPAEQAHLAEDLKPALRGKESTFSPVLRKPGQRIESLPGIAQGPASTSASPASEPIPKTSESAKPASTQGTPVPKPLENRNGLSVIENEVHQFVNSYLDAAQQAKPDSEMSYYAEKVNYFNYGQVGRGFIAADQKGYYRRWPSRQFVLEQPPELLEIGGSEVVVKFRMKYTVRNGHQTAEGRTEETIHLVRGSSGYRIAAIQEKKV